MDKAYESRHHRMEETGWWFVARRDFIMRLLKAEDKNSKILDVGCCGGSLLRAMADNGFSNAVGIDKSLRARDEGRKRGVRILVMDGVKTNFSDREFDIVIASDVLEHIRDDSAALKEWNRILRPGGLLLVFVPAFAFLWSGHDKANAHYRRYGRTGLMAALGKAGFAVTRSSYWNFALFFPTALLRIFSRLLRMDDKKDDNLFALPGFVNFLLISFLKLENLLLGCMDFPAGVSVFAVARKKIAQPSSFYILSFN